MSYGGMSHPRSGSRRYSRTGKGMILCDAASCEMSCGVEGQRKTSFVCVDLMGKKEGEEWGNAKA